MRGSVLEAGDLFVLGSEVGDAVGNQVSEREPSVHLRGCHVPDGHGDALASWLQSQFSDHVRRQFDPVNVHASLAERQRDSTGTDGQLEGRSRSDQSGQELDDWFNHGRGEYFRPPGRVVPRDVLIEVVRWHCDHCGRASLLDQPVEGGGAGYSSSVTSAFFEPIPPPMPDGGRHQWSPPAWDRPSEGAVPWYVPVNALVHRNDDAVGRDREPFRLPQWLRHQPWHPGQPQSKPPGHHGDHPTGGNADATPRYSLFRWTNGWTGAWQLWPSPGRSQGRRRPPDSAHRQADRRRWRWTWLAIRDLGVPPTTRRPVGDIRQFAGGRTGRGQGRRRWAEVRAAAELARVIWT